MDDDTHTHILGVGGVGDNQQNLNDLQSYLVNFNKEIGVHGEPGSTFSVSQIISQASHQPVFVTVPVSSETSTPDDEQLPVISGIKDGSKTPDIDSTVNSTDTETDNGDHNIYTEMDGKHSPLETVVVDSQIDSLDSGRIQLQELNLDQLGLQTGIAVSDGMIMLPMGDASSILAPSADHKLAQVQIVTINGQPTLQLVGDPNILQQQLNSVTGGVTESHTLQSIVPTSSIQSLIDSTGTSPIGVLSSADTSNSMAVLASVSANTVHQSQLHNIHTLPATDTPQLVTLQGQTDGSHPHVMALSYNNLVTAAGDATLNQAQNTVDLLKKTNGGFQSVAILPSGDGTQDGEVNYVLIVNPAGDKSNVSGQMYDFGDNLTGEVVEEMTDETGATQRLVKINQLLSANQIQHNRDMPGDLLSCTHCDYTSNKKYLLSRHMKSHCDDRPHKCGMCTKGFKSVSSLQNHLNTHTGVRPHKCRVCESAFTTSGELIRHIRYKHTFEKPHKCTECEYASVELSKLKRHMRSHTGERPYACCYCNYASPDTYKLKRHLRIHTGEKPYECDVCHAKFTQSNSLKAHKLIHSGNKPVFKCALCPATCGRKTDLKIHMQKLHSTDQTLVCKKCGETFSDRYSLKVHFKSHEGEKCFKCVECDYSATTQRHVDAHMMIHSGLKPFECEDCDLTFRLKKLLKRHRVMYHNPNYVSSEDKTDEPDCQACEMLFIKKNTPEQSNIEIENNMKDSHTCGGYPKSIYLSQVDPITPLTADQLIENSLLADMKEGKLGTSPKVVVVHPDGRVEEVTAKLQSLSQTKPNETMEDFLVSLGVSGETQFDQVSSLPGDVCVTEVQTLVSGKDTMHFVKHCKEVTEHNDITSSIETQSDLESNSFTVSGMVPGLVINTDQTKEESTQASFDSDDDIKKVKILPQEPFLQLTSEPATDTTDLGDCFEDSNYKIDSGDQTVLGTTSQNITMVTMLQPDDNRSLKRPAGDSMDDHHVNKSLKTDTTLTDV